MLVIIFYHIDEFCKIFEQTLRSHTIENKLKSQRNRQSALSLSEIMTICVFYHHSGYKNFKAYYTNHVLVHMTKDFKKLVSYTRFIELKKNAMVPLALFLKIYANASCTGISFADSSALKVCHNRRIYSHKVFKNIAQRGHTSMGWFYGFKVHLVINHMGELINFNITSGNVADNNSNLLRKLFAAVRGKLFADKGYILKKDFFAELYAKGLQVITKIRANMKNILMDMGDKLGLRKRGTIESVIGVLKESLDLEHSRHRSPVNFFVHVLSSLTAYCFRQNKPSIIGSKRCINNVA